MIQSHQWRGFPLDLYLFITWSLLLFFFALTCLSKKHDYFLYILKCFGKELDNELKKGGDFLEHGKYQADDELSVFLELKKRRTWIVVVFLAI